MPSINNDPLVIMPGQLRHSIIIQQSNATRDAAGQSVDIWETVRMTFAGFENTSGRAFKDSFSSNALAAQSTELITVRWTPVDIKPGMRVQFGGHLFLIQAVDNVQRRNRKILLACIAIAESSN
jgi:SPP1 family predicted phage head-tail adaptor